jgi:formate dehydrogenase
MARTVCRVCESGCGLIVDVVDGRISDIRPDPDDPESRGYACVRGLGFGAFVHAPDRPVTGWLRRDGALRPTPMKEAVTEVAKRLRALVDAHGPDAVGLYAGNATAFSLPALAGLAALQRGIGTEAAEDVLPLLCTGVAGIRI